MTQFKRESTGKLTPQQLQQAIHQEAAHFEKFYQWLEEHMPAAFFEEFTHTELMTIVHNFMGLNIQGNFIQIHFEHVSIILSFDEPDSDLRVLKNYTQFDIVGYQTFLSNAPTPFPSTVQKLRVSVIRYKHTTKFQEEALPFNQDEIFNIIHEKHPEMTPEKFSQLLQSLNERFLRFLTKERLILILEKFLQATNSDHMQYEIKLIKEWNANTKKLPSMQIIFAWKNTQKYKLLYRLAKVVFRHGLFMKFVNSSYVQTSPKENILLMSLAIHGQGDIPAWEATNLKEFLKDLSAFKYFSYGDEIEETFVDASLLTGSTANLLRSLIALAHQFLLHTDANLYSLANIEKTVLHYPELSIHLIELFDIKFDKNCLVKYEEQRTTFLQLISQLDTGHLSLNMTYKTILNTLVNLVHYIEKTNFYCDTKMAYAFRLNSNFFTELPANYKTIFPETPYGIFFLYNARFIGFHIRFQDLARGGIRTIFPYQTKEAEWERKNILLECYNLALTQQKKNKDIPEGGAKGIILIMPNQDDKMELQIYHKEIKTFSLLKEKEETLLDLFQQDQREIILCQSQRAYVESILSLVNFDSSGKLKDPKIQDFYQKQEYLYFGPDENLNNKTIRWIAAYSKKVHYGPGISLITSKPLLGINHKEFGVTSCGVNVYMTLLLHYLGFIPEQNPFTIKISGGPDGDVAGNQIYNLYRFYPKTAKILAIKDGSGTMYDPNGINLEELINLFREGLPIRSFCPEKLSPTGFLLDLHTKKNVTAFSQKTLCYQKEGEKIIKTWLSGNQTHHLYNNNIHQVVTDVFIPAGGRPKTLNQLNWRTFLQNNNEPTAKIIIEGANLYLTNEARTELENCGVWIIKDSSANKGGVICSSLEVLSGLLLSENLFLQEKPIIVQEILNQITKAAKLEGNLLLSTKEKTGEALTKISEQISQKIHLYTQQILDHLLHLQLPINNLNHSLTKALINFFPPIFKQKYQQEILTKVPPVHQKAIIACAIACHVVYTRGVQWEPSIVDILPLLSA